MHKIVALWAVPRSTSTAFEWMMRQRGDMDCLHEPFGEAWYQGENPLWPRFKEGDKTTAGLTIDSVWQDIVKTITSIYDKWPDFDELEIGFPEQRALFDLLHAINGTPPPVIDSDDLLENPYQLVKGFCDAVEIPFIPEALEWESGADTSDYSWWDGGSFHSNLRSSTGLTPQPRRYIELSDAPERVQRVHRRMKPHYDHLYQHRLTLTG